MGDQVSGLLNSMKIPVEPTGSLLQLGWMPGTWVKYSTNQVTFSGALATVERSDGTGNIAGFLATGPQHNQPVELLSDMWTTDRRQREGGDTHADWGAFDATLALDFDAQKQLQRMGSRVVSMYVANEGLFKFYVFETVSLAERTVPGTGFPLVYLPNQKVYVSDRGRLTNEKEQLNSTWAGYITIRVDSDVQGDYVMVNEGVSS
jgi:hypothetical protein